jgi:cbb3-type cytochrome oxidase subunit 3
MEPWTQYIWLIGIPIAFLLIVVYVFRPRGKKRYEQDARIPFKEKEKPVKETKERDSQNK